MVSKIFVSASTHEKITIKQIQTLYDSGKRDFTQLNLRQINLQQSKLPEINLEGSDLRNADLRNADLSRANLRNCYLHEANLMNANLTNANLNGAYLIKANCEQTIFKKANLNHSFFTHANLSKADLTDTILKNTYLCGAILTESTYNDNTFFKKNFNPERQGLIKLSFFQCQKKYTIAELIGEFQQYIEITISYLGQTITAKNFYKTCPNNEWLKQFLIDKQGKISYQGSLTSEVSLIEINCWEKWISSFIKQSSLFVSDLPKVIKQKKSIV